MRVVETHGLEKRYGKTPVISSLDMRVDKGDIYGLLGRNGAGKSTLLKMLYGLTTPTAGEIILFDDAEDARERIGAFIERPGLFPNLNAYENMMTKAYALGLVDAEAQCENLLVDVGLASSKQKARDFSRGMRQRLGIALALLGSPDLLLLDEPFNGLDLEGTREIRDLFKRLVQTTDLTVVITSHVPGHLNHMATRYGIIRNGTMLREMTHDQMEKERVGGLLLRTTDTERTIALLDEYAPEADVRAQPDGSLTITNYVRESVIGILHDNAQTILELATIRDDITDYFTELMEGGIDDVQPPEI